jgi:molybdopterin-containing oxidoreductase family iron-sulfur binding subunit
MSTANQKQALVHIYIVTGSAIAVTLDNQFKAEVTKAAMH